MKKLARLGMVAAATFAAVATSTSAASAAPSGDPNVTRVATPADACASIPATVAAFGLSATGFDYTSCVRTLAGGVPDLPAGDPYEQCAALEQGIETPFGPLKVTYPGYVFHSDPSDPFPNLRVNNREQCARALYALHTIESFLPAGPPPGD